MVKWYHRSLPRTRLEFHRECLTEQTERLVAQRQEPVEHLLVEPSDVADCVSDVAGGLHPEIQVRGAERQVHVEQHVVAA